MEDESDSNFSWWLGLARIGGPIRRHYCNYVICWALIWATCVACLFAFFWEIFAQYREENPIAVISFSDLENFVPPIKVKVCNSFYLDPEKILSYNGTNLKLEAYEYLYEAASGNHQFDDTSSVYYNDVWFYLAASRRVFKEFAMDVDQFLLSCSWSGNRDNCSNLFSYVQEPLAVCYEAVVQLKGFGSHTSFNMFFYFNSSKFLGKYTKSLGAYVIVSDPEDFIPVLHGTFVKPNDFPILALRLMHRKQKQSFKKFKCVHKIGLDSYNFTGEPFNVTYNPHFCKDLCYVEAIWKVCECAAGGVNMKKSECLELEENRKCVYNPNNYMQNYEWAKTCMSKCLNRCDAKQFKVSVLRENWKFNPNIVSSFLKQIVHDKKSSNTLAWRLLNQIEQSKNKSAEALEISQNIAQCSIYLMADQPITSIEIVEMVNFSTFLSKIGGLLGMWLGLSVISAVKMLQNWLQKLYLGSQMFRKKPLKVKSNSSR